LTQRGLGRSVCTVVSPEDTRSKGRAVQSHPLPRSFWQTTCTSGRMGKMREGVGGQEDTVHSRVTSDYQGEVICVP